MASQTPVVHQDDVGDWINRVKGVVNKPDTLTAPRPAGASAWHNDFFGCFDPIDTCVITCFCPCVTFGKTHHRLRKDPTLKDYSPVNATCIGYFLSSYVCLHWLGNLIQRHEIKERNNLDGDIATDCFKAWCCNCCDLIQQDKEAAYHALSSGPMVETAQPTVKETMVAETTQHE